MLKKVIPVIFLVMMLFSVSASAETDIETLGKKFFQDMDFSESYLADVKNAVDAQDYNAAFSAYKKIVFDRILKYGDDGVFTVEMSQKDTEKGEKLYNENTFTFVNRTYIETEHYFGEPGSYLWIVGGDYNDGDRNALINDMEWAANLMQCYLESGDTKYLDRWLLIWDDYSLNYRNRETDEEQEAADRMAKWGLTIERRFIARQAPIYQSLKYNYNEFFEHFDNQYFAHYIDQTIEEAIDNDAWTNSTANQLLATLIARIKLYSLMPEITILKESFEETGRSFTDYYLASMFLKDGMDKEMSLTTTTVL